MKRNYLAPYLEKLAAHYHADGYNARHSLCWLGIAFRFAGWLEAAHVPPDRVTAKHADEFLRCFVLKPSTRALKRRKYASAAVHRVLRLIWAEHPPVVTHSPSWMEADRYADHLRRDRGLAEDTVEWHRRHLGRFLESCFRRRPVDLSSVTAKRIHAHVDALPHGRANSRRRHACVALRGYFRFLQMHGAVIGNLLTVVPIIHVPRAALSSRWMTVADVEQLLRSIDRSKAAGKRDYAAILCMIHFGLRVGDVPRLSLDDIDWREGAVLIANHKPGRPYQMPLPRRLGKALVAYLAKGRPPSPRREIFLCHTHPRGAPVTAKALQYAVQCAWCRAGLGEKFSGTHILRHSAATRMRQKGVGMKTIADVLGHRSLQTTRLYAQVDLPALRAVAQPWPEVRS